jgi:hypothetical protein
MLNERLPTTRGWRLHNHDPEEFNREESGDENSSFGHEFDTFSDGRRGYGDGRHTDFDNLSGRHRAHGCRVRFEDEESKDHDREEGSDENLFANDGMFGRRHHHRHADFENRDHYHGRRDRNDPDHIAWVKLDIPKFTRKESAYEYLNWDEQCDQIFRVHNFSDQHWVNLASVEFSGYGLTWWNQLQEHQLRLGLRHINTREEMKRVMKRWFVPSIYQRDLQNRLQLLKQGKKFVDEYSKDMELLLVQTGIREDPESTMARFLGRLNEEISGFVEMFPYRTLQDLVDQAMRTERKIQQESRGKSYASHYNVVPWCK